MADHPAVGALRQTRRWERCHSSEEPKTAGDQQDQCPHRAHGEKEQYRQDKSLLRCHSQKWATSRCHLFLRGEKITDFFFFKFESGLVSEIIKHRSSFKVVEWVGT